jgi:hypothetical protein
MCSFSTRQRSIENNIDTIGSLIVSKQRLIENNIDTIDNLIVSKQRSIENNIDTIGSLIVSKQRLIENDIDTIDNLTVSKQRLASMIWINLCSAGYWQTLFPWTKIEINTDTIDCVRTANYIVANNIVVILWFGWWLTTRLMIPRALQRTKRHRIPWQNSKIFLTLFSTETDAGAWFSTHLCTRVDQKSGPIFVSPRTPSETNNRHKRRLFCPTFDQHGPAGFCFAGGAGGHKNTTRLLINTGTRNSPLIPPHGRYPEISHYGKLAILSWNFSFLLLAPLGFLIVPKR